MAEEIQDNKENQPEKEDNRLPYEKPKLRKHGKVNDTTLSIPPFGSKIDSRFLGPPRALS